VTAKAYDLSLFFLEEKKSKHLFSPTLVLHCKATADMLWLFYILFFVGELSCLGTANVSPQDKQWHISE